MKLSLLVLVVVAVARAQILHHHDNCASRCFGRTDYAFNCQCDYDCEIVGNCCDDFWMKCRGSLSGFVVTPKELNTFAQSIWDNDVNRIDSALYNLNYQGATTTKDNVDAAPGNLITTPNGQLDAILANHTTTYPSFVNLLDNYAANVQFAEHRNPHEVQEENRFWNAISQTQVMQLAFHFLVDNGFIKSDIHAFRTVINEMWFELYPKAHTQTKSNSGFEHIMIGEKTPHHGGHGGAHSPAITGFRNWVQYYQQEKAGHLDYQGYIKYDVEPNIVDIRFHWKNATARGTQFFVGTSPEFDMALYTVCALVHPNKQCSVIINGRHINVQTTLSHHQQIKQLVDAFPKVHNPRPTENTPH